MKTKKIKFIAAILLVLFPAAIAQAQPTAFKIYQGNQPTAEIRQTARFRCSLSCSTRFRAERKLARR